MQKKKVNKANEKFVIPHTFENLIQMSVEGNPKSKRVLKSEKIAPIKS